jgi:hypothetical protein
VKRVFIGLMLLMLVVPVVEAARKKDKAGRISEGVYKDKTYGFSLTMDEGWKVNVQKNKHNTRLVFIQKNYLIPSDYTTTPDFAKIPKISVYADTTSLSVYTFIDSLLSESYDWKQKDELKKDFDLLTFNDEPDVRDVIPRGAKRLELAGERGTYKNFQANYVKMIPTSARSMADKRVDGAYGASIIGIKHGDRVYLFHIVCEWTYFNDVFSEAMGIITSLTWEDEEG